MKENTHVIGIGQIARTVQDLAASIAWYTEVLGLPHLYTFGSMAFFDCNGTRLMLSQSDELAPESILYFATRDIASSAEQARAKGVSFIQDPQCVHQHEDGRQEWMGFFNDLEGRPLGLIEQRAAV